MESLALLASVSPGELLIPELGPRSPLRLLPVDLLSPLARSLAPSPLGTLSSSAISTLFRAPMESRLSATGASLKSMKISMESERMFNDLEEEMSPTPASRELRRGSSRLMSPSSSTSSMAGASRVSVKEQLYSLECKVQSHEDTIQKLMSIHQADKALLLSKIDEITERMGEELHKIRLDHQKKLNTASEEIERLNKCLNVQRGHITTLQEQCQSLHKHVVQVDDDVTKLAAEVLGE